MKLNKKLENRDLIFFKVHKIKDRSFIQFFQLNHEKGTLLNRDNFMAGTFRYSKPYRMYYLRTFNIHQDLEHYFPQFVFSQID